MKQRTDVLETFVVLGRFTQVHSVGIPIHSKEFLHRYTLNRSRFMEADTGKNDSFPWGAALFPTQRRHEHHGGTDSTHLCITLIIWTLDNDERYLRI